MRNRFYYILIGILFSFSFINNVYADTAMSLHTESTSVSEGSTTSIMVKIKSDVNLSSCIFQISSDGDVIFSSSDGINDWEVEEERSSVGTFVSNTVPNISLSKGVNVLELKYIINGKGTVNVEALNCVNTATGKEVTDIGSKKIDFTATAAVKDTTLSSLSVDGGTFLSSFSSQKDSYEVRLASSNFSISYTTSDSSLSDKVVVKHGNDTITKLQNIKFVGDDQGTMIIKITVDGKTTYNLFLKYKKTGLDNTLKSVKINGKNLTLEQGKYDYEYEVEKDVNSFSVEPILNDSENFKFSSLAGGNVLDIANFSISDSVHVRIVIVPKDASTGIEHLVYDITVTKKGTTSKPVGGTQSKPNVGDNPGTGGMSMYIMLFVLIVSLIGSVLLYQKSLESYK